MFDPNHGCPKPWFCFGSLDHISGVRGQEARVGVGGLCYRTRRKIDAKAEPGPG
jgi:hypothetical protein